MPHQADFLIEIGTEELPPKSLKKLSTALTSNVVAGLAKADLTHAEVESFAAPRRLAILIKSLAEKQADRTVNRRGPALQAAYDKEGNPTKACVGFAKSCGINIKELDTETTEKGSWVSYQQKQVGKTCQTIMPEIINAALKKLPIPKPMRWGSLDTEFIRPVHWLVMLYGSEIIGTSILGIKAGNETKGHRFHHPANITINSPAEYENSLEARGNVIAGFERRRDLIRHQIQHLADKLHAQALIDDALLDEVTGLVEWPVALQANFDKEFLLVPQEVLISAMQSHQKSFALLDKSGKILPHFITVSNIESAAAQTIVTGNERVMRARLADADFFYHTDLKIPFNQLLDRLSQVTFQKQLGSIYEKSERIAQLAEYIAKQMNTAPQHAQRAGLLTKTDLVTDMVGEFPELQGIMGYYYATRQGEASEVAQAIKEHYLPRFSGDELPHSLTGCAVAIADKLDTLVGIFGINQAPTGDKDPFALRRAAMGILRIMIEKRIALDLKALLQFSVTQYKVTLTNANLIEEIMTFMYERLRAWYHEQGIAADVITAVITRQPNSPYDFHQRIQAVTEFRKLPEAAALAAANKRVSNILRKEGQQSISGNIEVSLLQETAEKELAALLTSKENEVLPLFQEQHANNNNNYTQALTLLASLQTPIDSFFDNVMVMVEDEKIRHNRLVLLAKLRRLFLHVADISLLQN